MAIPNEEKEVLFHLFCPTCKHWELDESEEPCASCLDEVTNLHSIKPVKYEEAKGKR